MPVVYCQLPHLAAVRKQRAESILSARDAQRAVDARDLKQIKIKLQESGA